MQKSCINFLHENFAEDQGTLIEQSVLQNHAKIFQHENILSNFLNENKANYSSLQVSLTF